MIWLNIILVISLPRLAIWIESHTLEWLLSMQMAVLLLLIVMFHIHYIHISLWI